MRQLKTISYFSEDLGITKKRVKKKILRSESADGKALSESNLRYMRSFQRHLENSNWERSLFYLKRLSKTSLFYAAIARSGFVFTDASKASRRELINRVIDQLNQRNKIRWLKDTTYHGYVNMVSNALYTEFRCDSVAAYFIIRDNEIRINRGWVQGLPPEETARLMQR